MDDRERKELIQKFSNAIKQLESELPLPARTVQLPGSRNVSGSPFPTFGEQMRAVALAGTPGGPRDSRLDEIRSASGLSETVPSDGGFLVQSDFSAELLRGVFDTGILASRCNRIPISGNSNSIKLPAPDETSRVTGSRWGGVRSYWLDEASEKQASKPKFRAIELNLKKNVVLVYATDEVLADSSVLERVIRQAATEEIGFAIDDAIVNGTGAGQPLGILNSGSLVTISKESGQSPATVIFENVAKMYSRMPARNRKNGVWCINQGIEPQLFSMSLSVGTGGIPVYMPAGGASGQPYGSLFGRPVLPIEQCSTLGTVGDIIFADFSSYILAEKGGIQSDVSIHVRYIFDESVFRFVFRCDGQPMLASAITPADGGDNLSPFVALETRS